MAAFDFPERFKALEALSISHSRIIQGIIGSQQKLETLMRSSITDFGRAFNLNRYVDSILVSIEASARINFNLDSKVVIPALQHVRAFQKFSERQVNAISHEPEEIGARRVIMTNLCGELAEGCHAAHEIGLGLSADTPQEIYHLAPISTKPLCSFKLFPRIHLSKRPRSRNRSRL